MSEIGHAPAREEFRFTLPIPPSLNNAYANSKDGRGRFPSKQHKEWKIAAGWLLKQSVRPKITGPYRFTILLPENMRGDCSNRLKLAEDLLVEHGITPDDSKAVSALAERSAKVVPMTCVVIVESV